VGGGDSALEGRLPCAQEPGTNVTLSYRSEAFSRVKQKNREQVQKAEAGGKLKVLLSSTSRKSDAETVALDQAARKSRSRTMS